MPLHDFAIVEIEDRVGNRSANHCLGIGEEALVVTVGAGEGEDS